MASAARLADRLDLGRTYTAADAAALGARLAGADAQAFLAAITAELHGRIAVVSSFGAESAVLLHLLSRIDHAMPVIFTDTGHHFAATLAYRDDLAARFGLVDVRTIGPDPQHLAARDAAGERYAYDPDGCCEIRKVAPLARALESFDAWISGRKAFQAATRAALPRVEAEDGRLKINPLADWAKADLDAYAAAHALPAHPLDAAGYRSVGCAPCTTPTAPGEDPRAGRWRGIDKVECGIHRPTM